MSEEARGLLARAIADSKETGPVAVEARAVLDEMDTFGLGCIAPEISGEDIDGNPMNLSDFRGKVVLLVFWGDRCPFCRSEYDAERHAFLAAAGKPFARLGVSSDKDRGTVKELIRSKGLPGRSWWDAGGTNGPIARAWKVHGWPTIFVLDAQGRIRVKGVRGIHIRRAVDAPPAEIGISSGSR